MNNDWGTSKNDLEAALVRAATDPAARPGFYKTLAESQLLIVPAGPAPPLEGGALKEAATLQLAQIDIQGQRCIPLFTSEARLPQGTRYLGLAARDLFNITQGATFVLNPGAQYGKMLLPDEVAQLLDGSLFKPSETFTIKKETKGLIGQPKDYPHDFVAALKRYFATEPSVEKAYLAQHFVPGVHTEPALLVSILAPEREYERIVGEVGIVARETKKAQSTVDITKYDVSTDSYFANQEPIYVRVRRGIFGKLFG
jgi:hypothetical protein